MWKYIGRRVLLMVPTFFGVTLVCFFVMRMANPDPVSANLEMGIQGGQISQAALEHLRATYDLDKPWYVQYGNLLLQVVTLSGTTWADGRRIAEVISEALPITLMLSFLSLIIAYLVAIPLGVFSAVKQYTTADKVTTVIVFMLYSLPSFWVGSMLLVFFGTDTFVECLWTQGACFPLQGWRSFDGFDEMTGGEQARDVMWHLVLPLIALTYNAFASTSRYMRTAMLDTIRQDYIRTARAKGLSEKTIIFKHALRNSLIPIITLLGLTLPYLISGSVIVEAIFGIRGMGLLVLEAIRMPDYPLVISLVAFTSIVTMIGILVSDILYAVVDPRIRYGKEGGK